jgi:pyruvate formate lyase activating enzyme
VGERGHCVVRKNVDSQLVLEAYGKTGGFALDPIEKKPLYHFLPGSSVLSFGTVGCNLSCQFCQNWQITTVQDTALLSQSASPREIAENALKNGARSVAFTYNEPVIFMEYAIDTAIECHARNIKTIAVTNGYINLKPAKEFYEHIDAANVDLKSFSDDFYKKYTDSSLKPVLKLLEYLSQQKKVWVEITTLIIPGYNDDDGEIKMLSKWIFEHMGPDTPLHFSAFHPDHQFMHVKPTPLLTLIKARETAITQGLNFVYTGNIVHGETESTICPHCQNVVIQRQGFSILKVSLNSDGTCSHCKHTIPGYYENTVLVLPRSSAS